MTPKPGDYGCVVTHGRWSPWIRWGEKLAGYRSNANHAFVVVSADQVIEARPGGVGIAPLASKMHQQPVFNSGEHLSDVQRDLIVHGAWHYMGSQYNWPAIGDFAWHLLGLPGHLPFSEATRAGVICSQLVARVYLGAGIRVDPTRESHEVVPAGLADRAIVSGYAG